MKLIERIINKITSCRFIISVLVTATLCFLAIRGDIDKTTFTSICVMVISYYFNKPDRNKNKIENE